MTVLFALGGYWAYTLADGLLNRGEYVRHLQSQVFPDSVTSLLTWLLPALNLLMLIFLLHAPWQRAGIFVSTVLFSLTAMYAALVIADYFPQAPCNCIGTVRNLSWEGHFILNLAGAALSLCGLFLNGRERRKV